jgi:hypothetical protein
MVVPLVTRMMDWQRRRAPDDVPTPVAVALSDFCRRARAAASPTLVRDALSCLPESQDRLVRALADSEPEATPLGPFAAVEVAVAGLAQAAAAELERSGHYSDVKRSLRAPLAARPPAPPAEARPEPAAEPKAPRTRRTKGERLAERIGPRRREAGAVPAPPPPAQVFGTAFLPRRNLPMPRGRFTRDDPTRASMESLLRADARADLQALVEQVPHRVALLRSLDHGYTGRHGEAMTLEDVAQALERHQLAERLATKERQAVLVAVSEARGALGKAAQALALKDGELERLVAEAGLGVEVSRLRDRFITEAIAPRHLDRRLELVGRGKYLKDLGIEDRFFEALERDLGRLLEAARPGAATTGAALERVAREQTLPLDLLRAACERLGLLGPPTP